MTALDSIASLESRADAHHHAADLMRLAYQAQGLRAFESTRRCAALHEAGHCIVNTILADAEQGGQFWPPDSTRIWRAPVKGLMVWLGETLPAKKAPPFHVDARVDLTGYLSYAVQTVGGIAAEMAFDGADYRVGSSVDEWVVAGGCARVLADFGLFADAELALVSLLKTATTMLTANESVVRAVAARLEAQRKVQGAELTALLRAVQREARPPITGGP